MNCYRIFLFLLLVPLLLFSCAPAPDDPLSVLSAPFSLSGTLLVDQVTYPVTVVRERDRLIIEAQTASGVLLQIVQEPDRVYLLADGIEAPLPSPLGGIATLLYPLSLSADAIVKRKEETAGARFLLALELASESSSAKLLLDQANLYPLQIDAAVGQTTLTLTVDSFTPHPDSQDVQSK